MEQSSGRLYIEWNMQHFTFLQAFCLDFHSSVANKHLLFSQQDSFFTLSGVFYNMMAHLLILLKIFQFS
jgi:hypothetical protein